ncbi:2-hydroxyhepta-2,4-diene-1,7-dioate isomerase, partial [Streptomyces prunicolor]|nr:2-hydroxyhepta-2,4-diene-1,7-dioate isomerase [Streptomyces prunicolor]
MKLLRVGTAGAERPALLDADGTLRDLSGIVPDIDGPLLADTAAL